VNTRNVKVVQDNVVGGTDDSGFVLYGETCGMQTPAIRNNEVHGALVGAFVMSTPIACAQLVNFVAWKCGHIGVLTVDQTANIRLDNITVADNHIGISLNYIRSGMWGRSDISNSRIFGSTAASTCSGSVSCRAVGPKDVYGLSCQSVFGNGYRRVGLISAQYLNRPKTCKMDGGLDVCRPPTTPERLCSLPWEKRYGLPTTSVHGEMYVVNTVFGYFDQVDCGRRSVAVALNPSQIDYTPHMFTSGISWTAVNVSARMDFGLSSVHPSECQTSCDSVNFAMTQDLDGSFLSAGAGALMSQANPLLAKNFPQCTSYDLAGSIHCPGMRLFQAMLENNDLDRGGRIFGPVRATKLDAVENRTVWSKGPFDDLCAKRFFFGQYPFALEPGNTYFLHTTGTMPSNSRIQFFSTSSSDVVLLKIFFTKPYTISVFNNGVKVPASTIRPTLNSARGANVLDPQERVLYLVLRGSATGGEQVYDLRTENNVQLSLSLKISEAEFFGPTLVNNLAMLLQIPASRIRIVAVHAQGTRRRLLQSNSTGNLSTTGGVSVNVEIAPPQSVETVASNTTALTENIVAQQTLMARVSEIATSGLLKTTLAASGIPLAAMSITPPPGVGDTSSNSFAVAVDPVSNNNNNAHSESSSNSIAVYIGAGAGAGVLVILVLFVVWAHQQKVLFFKSKNQKTFVAAEAPTPSIVVTIPDSTYQDSVQNDSASSTNGSQDSMQFIEHASDGRASSSFSELSHGQIAPSTVATSPPHSSWSRPDCNRAAANKLLESQFPGTFVVYGKGLACLAVKYPDGVHHIPIVKLERALPRFRLAIDDQQPWHSDIASLIKFYQSPRDGMGGVVLTVMAARPWPSPRPTRSLSPSRTIHDVDTVSPSNTSSFARPSSRGSQRLNLNSNSELVEATEL